MAVEVNAAGKSTECYLGLLYAMEDVAVYGYITPLKVKIVLALSLSDSVVRDVEVNMVRRKITNLIYLIFSKDFQGPTHGLLFRHFESFPETGHIHRHNERHLSLSACRKCQLERFSPAY